MTSKRSLLTDFLTFIGFIQLDRSDIDQTRKRMGYPKSYLNTHTTYEKDKIRKQAKKMIELVD
ncbi:hypothetical protein MARINOS108_20776 [Marinoscillum sp. 108]|nr:hypothetical protein MARINOS108_20776 [Marinoscillum sp. 108]